MAKKTDTESITVRCPSSIINSIEQQIIETEQNKTDVIVSMLSSSIPSLHITERAKLPSQPGIYFVYTPDHKLLYLGKADNLRTRWNSHHKYQFFIESSIESRIGYFSFDSVDSFSETIEEFKTEPVETTTSKALATTDQIDELKQELETLKKRFNDTFSALTSLGVDSVIKKLESYLPPRELQKWNHSKENVREGITRSDLISKLGFGTTKALEEAAGLLELDPDKYLEELSGWQKQPVEEGSSRTRFFLPK